MTKFCKDCRWCATANFIFSSAIPAIQVDYQCNHPNNFDVSLVDGSSRVRHSCETQRAGENILFCKKEGSWWEPTSLPKISDAEAE